MIRHSFWILLHVAICVSGVFTNPVVIVVLDNQVVQDNVNIPKILTESHILNNQSNVTSVVTFVPFKPEKSSQIIPKMCEYVQDGIVAVLDMSNHANSDLLRSFCVNLGIAYVPALDLSYMDHTFLSESNGTTVYVEPPGSEMLKIVADIAQKENLNDIAIVYDETFDIQNTPRRLLTNIPAQHMYIRIQESDEKLESSIQHLMKINMRIVFLIASRAKAQRFLSKILTLKGKNFDPNIFVLTKDRTLTCDACRGSENILLVTAKTKLEERSRFIDYMKASGIDHEFQPERIKVDEAMVFDLMVLFRHSLGLMSDIDPISFTECHNMTSPVVRDVRQSQEIISTLSGSSVFGVFGPLAFEPEKDVIKYDMTVQIKKMTFYNGPVTTMTSLATWTPHGGLFFEPNISTLIARDKQKTYRIVTVAGLPPFMYKTMPSANSSMPPIYKGYCHDLIEKIAVKLDFKYEMYDVPTIGNMDANGEWSGAIKELIENRADIAVGPISVMAERENVIDFTVPYYDLVGLTILMKKPGFDYSLVKFLSVLDTQVWACILGAFALFSILISLFDRLSPFSYQNQKTKWNGDGAEPRIFSLKEGVWFCMMSLTPQGGGETPRALSGRLVAATWWLFGFIIIATYTANLAAFLTVSRLEQPIESLDDLSKQFKVQYAPQSNSMAHVYFERMKYIEERFYEIWKNMSLDDKLGEVERAKLAVWDYPVSDKYTKLLETMKKTGFPATKDEAIKRVMKGNFAFIADSTTNKYEAKINCDVGEVGEEFSRKPYALAVQEGSPLRSELSNVILQLINQRSLEELKTRWWSKDKKECPKLEDESDGISIRNIGGVFLVIVIGSGFSLIALAFECYWYRLRPGAKRFHSSKEKGPVKQQVKQQSSSHLRNKEMEDNTANKKKENGGLDSNFVSILDAGGYSNSAFDIVERL